MEKYNSIKESIINGNIKLVEQLILDFDLNKIDEDGNTLLHHACENEKINIIKLLLNNGSNPNIHDKKFKLTPLHWATEYEDEDMIELLIENGANPELKDIHGDKPNNNTLTKKFHDKYLSNISKLLKNEQTLSLAKTEDIDFDLIETISKFITTADKETQRDLIDRFIKQADENQHNNIIGIYKDRLTKANNISNPEESEKERIKIVGQFIKYIHRKKGSKKYHIKSKKSKSKKSKSKKSESKKSKSKKKKSKSKKSKSKKK